jgi:uncharacterized protein YdeI (YjbR/CyaY-like superfamily)
VGTVSPRVKKAKAPAAKPRAARPVAKALVSVAAVEAVIVAFEAPKAWGAWLRQHHGRAEGVWFRFFKKDSGVATLSYQQALDEALCWGWIDGQVKKHDADSWLQRFTPRRPRSVWSKRNREHIARLEAEGRLQAPGRAQVEAARADGRWDQAYDSPAASAVPEDFLAVLARFPKALAHFNTLNKANRYAISWRLQTAKKPETRQRRFEALLAMMKREEKLH